MADERGSVIAYVDEAGAAVQKNADDAFGQMKAWNEGVFAYTGQQFLPELGLYHYKARLYHPAIGRFLQTDPIGYDADMNLYAYVYNDPISFTDATGRKPDHIQDRFNAATAHAALNHPRKFALVMGVSAATAAPFYGGAGAYALGSRFLFQGISAGRVGGTLLTEEFAVGGAASLTTASAVSNRGIDAVEGYLRSIDALDFAPNVAMIERLKSGERTVQDLNFYQHELIEAGVVNRLGLDVEAAHLETLKLQGIEYAPGFQADIYAPDVIDTFPDYFNQATRNRLK
ncbi:MAG: RHS repeat-associated core domain-containing protein [Pseudomonadota bacterium]